MRTRTLVFTSFLVVTLMPLAIGALATDAFITQNIRDQVVDQLSSTAETKRDAVEGLVEANQEMLALTASRTQLRTETQEYQEDNDPDRLQVITQILEEAVESTDRFLNASVHALEGNVIASTDPSQVDTTGHEDAFAAGLERQRVDLFTRRGGTPINLLAAPMTIDGEPVGVLVIEASNQALQDIASHHAGLGQTGETLIAEATSQGARYLVDLRFDGGVVRFDGGAALQATEDEQSIDAPVIQILKLGRIGEVVEGVDYRGEPVFAWLDRVESTDWAVAVKMDQAELLQPLIGLRVGMVTLFLVATAMIVAGGVIMTGSISRPLRLLADHAHEVQDGNLEHRLRFDRRRTPEEIRAVILAMDDMAKKVTRIADDRLHTLHTASQEVHVPLAPLKLESERLAEVAERLGDEELQRIASGIASSTARITHTSDRVKQIIRLNRQGTRLDRETVDLARFVTSTVDRFKQRNDLIFHEVHVDVPQLVEASIDMERVRGALERLLENSIRFSPGGGDVQVTVRDEGGLVTIEVEDHGIGFRPEEGETLFEPFATSKEAESMHLNEAGLGLTLVRTIMMLHDGDVEASSEGPGKGARFRLWFPKSPPRRWLAGL